MNVYLPTQAISIREAANEIGQDAEFLEAQLRSMADAGTVSGTIIEGVVSATGSAPEGATPEALYVAPPAHTGLVTAGTIRGLLGMFLQSAGDVGQSRRKAHTPRWRVTLK